MKFVDRQRELDRLDRLMASPEGSLAVLHGRRRIGKTRLLLEWTRRHGGLYTVADQSAAAVQRRYFAEALETHLPGFGDVEYPDWRRLLERLAREARIADFRGPIVFDELPYLILSSPELPSVLQRWIDHEARQARLVVAVAGSSQRMMQGAVLSREAPLFGRATVLLALEPIPVGHLREILPGAHARDIIDHHVAWGGVPRYWELAIRTGGPVREQVDELVLDPLGPLHREPDRLLLEEIPSAAEVRPVLDAVGAGAHRLSEIGGRLGRPATSLSRPLQRLAEMGLVRREVPFGESERQSRRSLYRIADPFFRLWFEVVGPHRAQLAVGSRSHRLELLDRLWPRLAAEAWEELCRELVPRTRGLGGGPWGPTARWWRGHEPEWDVVSRSVDGETLLLGEVKWTGRTPSARDIARWAGELERRARPNLPSRHRADGELRALFLVDAPPELPELPVKVITAESLLELAAE